MVYDEETTKMMVERYTANPTRETVEELKEELNKPLKSIISKLSREGVYRKEEYKTKTGQPPVTKLELVAEITDALGGEVNELEGLEKAPKQTLFRLIKLLV